MTPHGYIAEHVSYIDKTNQQGFVSVFYKTNVPNNLIIL